MWLHILDSNLTHLGTFLGRILFSWPPGAHILIKWTKTLQDKSAHHFVQVPALRNKVLCPVSAIHELLDSRQLSGSQALFSHRTRPYHPVIDTTIRDS